MGRKDGEKIYSRPGKRKEHAKKEKRGREDFQRMLEKKEGGRNSRRNRDTGYIEE